MIVAHRGASRDAPENTIPAFNLAWEQGADAIEGDFHLTQDGRIVCIHNKDTERVAGRKLVVQNSTLGDLRRLDVGSYRGKKCRGTAIPTIAEVFGTIPGHKKVYVEIKCGIEIIPALLKQIDESQLKSEQIVMISFNQNVIRELKNKAPQYKAFWLYSFKKENTGKTTPSLETVMNALAITKADGLSSNPSIPGDVIDAIAQKGCEWHVWTVDDPKTARGMKALGALSITSNVPGYLRETLAEQTECGRRQAAAPGPRRQR
jgi:glycerophosphoryl diester phosphodiesterase